VDIGQVGVVASYDQNGVWVVVDTELCLPASWLTKEKKALWEGAHIPPDREFARKLNIAQTRVDHAIDQGLPFEVVGTDPWDGRDGDVRDQIGRTGKYDMGSIPGDPDAYLHAPQGGHPTQTGWATRTSLSP